MTYTYDGDGNRVQKSNGKLYWYGNGQVIDESDASGNMQESYVFFNGKLAANRLLSTGVISYYAEDMLGSSRVITTATGVVCYDTDFYPYGAENVVTNTCPQNYKWTGKERDAETGNDNFDARYYSSTYGRFLSADWSAVPAPVPYANLTNPQTLNLYAIVRDNPESYADLDGHDPPGSPQDDSKKENADKAAHDQTAQQTQNANTMPLAPAAPFVLPQIGEGVVVGGGIGVLVTVPLAAMTAAVLLPPMAQGDPMTPGYVPAPPLPAQINTNAQTNPTNAPMQSGFSDKTKNDAREKAGGTCEYCGQATVPGQKSQKGVKPPANEGQTDHYKPRSRGGADDASNARHACRACNGAKSDTPPQGTKWQIPNP